MVHFFVRSLRVDQYSIVEQLECAKSSFEAKDDMSSIPRPKPGEPLYPDGSSAASAVIEVVAVGAAFIVVAHLAAAGVNLEAVMPSFLSGSERQVGATFIAGAAAQIVLVLIVSFIFNDMRRAIGNSLKFGTVPAWGASLIAICIHAATIAFLFLDEPGLIFEPSGRNLMLSIAPAFDGWSQEVFFRGYVVYRLARGGLPVAMQIALSALMFAAIHIGYVGADFFSFFWPMFGTAVLGAFFAWSVLLARGALLPVIFCHAALIAIVQPWLALA